MNKQSGVFTAPFNGRYHFSFAAHAPDDECWVALRLNNVYTATSGSTKYGTVSITVTLNLSKGDRVDSYLHGGKLFDNTNQHTMFSGILLEQDLIF